MDEQPRAASEQPSGRDGRRRWAPWAVAAWSVAILTVCWLPARRLPISESPEGMVIPHLDKLVHFGIFAVLGGLCHELAGKRGKRPTFVAYGVMLAVISELGQAIPFVKREPGLMDCMADIAGFLAGLVLTGKVKNAFGTISSGRAISSGRLPPN